VYQIEQRGFPVSYWSALLKFFLTLFVAVTAACCTCTETDPKAIAIEIHENGVKQLAAAKLRWPEVTRGQLDSGAAIFRTKCTRCHAYYMFTYFSEARWKHELYRMARLAEFAPDEEIQVTRFIFSARDVERMRGN
jgi:hypothetical protein